MSKPVRIEDLRGQPIEVWREAKSRLRESRGSTWTRVDQHRNLQNGYQRSCDRHQRREEARRPVDRAEWERRLDQYMSDFARWKAGLLGNEPAKPSHFEDAETTSEATN